MRLLPVVMLVMLLLTGCGQKGPLVLPGHAEQASADRSSTDAPAPDAASANDDVAATSDQANGGQPE